jgi:hypothetical protein
VILGVVSGTRVMRAVVAAALAVASAQGASRWYRGNTHTHTINSDGDSAPDEVVRWYRQHGYDFLFITDHNMVTDVAPLNALFGGGGQFLVLPGEEVTSNFGNFHVHVNSLSPEKTAPAEKGATAREILQKDLDSIQAAHGLTQINHPNFFWQLTADDIVATRGARLLEIANMHPIVNSFGAGPTAPSAEEIWDQVLSRGGTIWAVASDDEHELIESPKGDPRNAGRGALPGRGWIVVRAQQLTAEDLRKAINAGDFYASTGVELQDLQVTDKRIELKIVTNDRFVVKFRTQFIGKNGRILQDGTANPAVYNIRGDEGYVRVKITDSNGRYAWTQPVFVH